MLIIAFDEHGGFYDHVPPPATVPTGDDHRYADSETPFLFDRLGVRVPALVISAYTQRGTVIGTPEDGPWFDHSSIPATVERRFAYGPLTQRDANASTLDVALNLSEPRVSPQDALLNLPDPAFGSDPVSAVAASALAAAAADQAPLSENQKSQLALALACHLEVTDLAQHPDIRDQYASITTQKQAAEYIAQVTQKIGLGQSKQEDQPPSGAA
jgi:phospholipase C